ncbi:peptide/nickel transport system permease protein [Piscibacillus halophilus]|uniref:Peptide/nickel transport system permease protein n=1 Tax=Piscibacillus halophilus TaxID=571933 RepID=A0A1H9HAV0_9BACI|nr:peptide/nickel transport system permease protein [Piscibacillus halophilus]
MGQAQSQTNSYVPVEHYPRKEQKPDSFRKIIFRKFIKNKLAVFGMVLLLIIISLALFAPWISPHSVTETDPVNKLQPPSAEHWLGTDTLGRDTFSRLLHGARVSLLVGFASVAGSLLIGVVLGA